MKKILVATGTSENKKGFAVDFIQNYMKNKGVDVEVVAANIYEVKIDEVQPDVIVAIGPANFNTDIPILQGTAFVTRMGMETVCDEIVAKLQ